MALKIRLRQQGKKNQNTYRLVLTDVHYRRDGKYIEMLGWYNPQESDLEKMVFILGERVGHWLSQGAQISERAEALMDKVFPQVMASYRQKRVAALAKACARRKMRKKAALSA